MLQAEFLLMMNIIPEHHVVLNITLEYTIL
jgi:hypothetical protein